MLLVARKIPLNITTEMQETLSKNFDALESAFDLMGLGLEAARKNYRNAVVIDKQVLNGDNMQQFKPTCPCCKGHNVTYSKAFDFTSLNWVVTSKCADCDRIINKYEDKNSW